MDLLLLADPEGRVDMTYEAISRRTGIPLSDLREQILVLQSPDSQSRSPDNEGRRLTKLDDSREWGWRITNYLKYRDIRSELDRRRVHSTNHYGGYVYFLTDATIDSDVKIGFSRNPWARINELAASFSNGCLVLGQIHGGEDTESEWHHRFANIRKNGEWFQKTPELLAAIDAVCDPSLRRVVTKKHRSTTPAIQKQKEMQKHNDKEGENLLTPSPSSFQDQVRGTGGNHYPEVNIPSLDDVLLYAQKIGLVDWKARDTYEKLNSTGWRDRNGNFIASWQSFVNRVRTWWEADGRPMTPTARNSGKQKTAFDIKTIIQAKESLAGQVKASHCAEAGIGETWDKPEHRSKYFKLKSEIKKLNQELSAMA